MYWFKIRSYRKVSLFVALLSIVTMSSGIVLAQSGTWTNTSGGDYNTNTNWAGNTIASGAGNTANFSTLDLPGDTSVTLNADLTIGNLLFGDTNNATTPGSWEFRTDNDPIPTITLDNGGSSPMITVNPLGPTTGGFDDAYIGHQLAGTNGFTKLGDGILTIGANAALVTGPINVNAGTLRYDVAGSYDSALAPFTLANGTTLQVGAASAFLSNVTMASGASATIRMNGGGSNFLRDVRGTGETLNLELGVSGATYTGEGDWTVGGGFSVINMTGLGTTGASNFRARLNRPLALNLGMYTNAQLNLDNVNILYQTNSGGNTMTIGELTGTATAQISGGNNASGGSAMRYVIGGLNTSSEFAGTINGGGGIVSPGTGGMSLDKVGTGTLTLSGTFNGTMVGANGLIERQGGVVRVSAGTLALTNTADNIPGGFDTFKSTIDVLAGATLDVSGTTNTFSSSPLQQIQGSGTIVGPFNHDEGEIRPADVSTAVGAITLTNLPVPTAGTITFDGNLSFNGGAVVFDMNENPGGDDLISVTGSTSVAGGGVVQPNFLGANPAAGLTYTFLNSAGGFSDAVAGWTVAWPGRGTKPAVVANGNLLQFTTTAVGAVGDVVWSGATNGDWDVETTQNWKLGGSPDVYFEGDNVTFNDTGADPAINVTTNLAPSSMTVSSSTNNYSFSGSSILSSGSLTKTGTSTLTLNVTNEFSGGAEIQGGTVNLGANNAMGTGPLTLSGATLNSATGAALGSSSLAVTAATTNNIQVDGGGGSGGTFGIPDLSGSGDLTINSATDDKWFSITNTADFSGSLTIGPNGAATALGNIRVAGGQTTFPNAVVNLSAVTLANRNGGTGERTYTFGELHGDAAVTFTGFVGGSNPVPNANWQIGNLNTDSDFAGVIVDGGGGGGSIAVSRVTKIGTGKLELTGISTYTGSTSVIDGELSITNAYLVDTADVFIMNSGVLDLNIGLNTDLVNALYLGGVPQAPGVYGATGSGAQFTSDLITGDGTLTVGALGAALLLGDYNGDGTVNAADYTVWRDNVGTNLVLANDGEGGVIGTAQYDQWVANFGNTLSVAAANAVPEPSSLTGLALLLLGFAAKRRRDS